MAWKINGVGKLAERIVNEMRAETDAKSKLEVEKLVSKLKAATPIDTGYARSRWQIREVSYLMSKLTPSLGKGTARFNVTFGKYSIPLVSANYVIENDAPYIAYLNQGYSKQAPPYFIEQTILFSGFKIR